MPTSLGVLSQHTLAGPKNKGLLQACRTMSEKLSNAKHQWL